MPSLSLLHVEDSKTDADLIKRQLRKAGIEGRYMLVDNETDFKKGIATFKPDIILCDHSMPHFNSKAAFEIYQKNGLDIPFILVTGTVSEEFAVEMLQAGIDDYLLKTNLQRLPNAISQAFSKRENERKIKNFQEDLQQSELQLRAIYENSAVGLILLDTKGKIIRLNNLAHYYMILSFSKQFKRDDNLVKDLTKTDKNFQEKFEQVMAGKSVNYESFYHRDQTEGITFNTSINPVKDIKGDVIGSCMTIEDISKRKKAELRLKLLESVITNTKEAVLITDTGGANYHGKKIVYANDAVTKITGYTPAELIGKSPKIFQGPKSDKVELSRFSEAMKKWEPCELTTINYRKNGEEYWVNFSVSPVANDKGKFTHWIGIERDVTEQKKSEIQLYQLNENLLDQSKKLTLSNEELEQFAYVASHDLQEPLRMVISFLNLLEKKYETILEEDGKMYIRFAVDGAIRMRQIIMDLLEFSRVGREAENIETIDINQLIDEIKQLYSKEIAEKNANIIADKLPKLTNYISPVRQIFQNLISNGLKYSRKNEAATIQIKSIDAGAFWQFAVTDNGIGIKNEYFDKIFVIFQRLHAREDFPGTGIGLAITKKIIENQGGKIWVESTEGKGSTFYFTLPKEMLIE